MHNQKWLIKNILVAWGIVAICVAIKYQLCESVCQLIADTQAELSAFEFGQKLKRFRIYGSSKFFTKIVQKYGSQKKKLNVNYVLNFRRMTYFRLCLLETQVNKLHEKTVQWMVNFSVAEYNGV